MRLGLGSRVGTVLICRWHEYALMTDSERVSIVAFVGIIACDLCQPKWFGPSQAFTNQNNFWKVGFAFL